MRHAQPVKKVESLLFNARNMRLKGAIKMTRCCKGAVVYLSNFSLVTGYTRIYTYIYIYFIFSASSFLPLLSLDSFLPFFLTSRKYLYS